MQHEPRWRSDRTPAGDRARDRAGRAVARRRAPAGAAARAARAAAAAGTDARAAPAGRRHRRRAPPNGELFPTASERTRRPDAADRAAAGTARPGPGAAPGGRGRPSARACQRCAGAAVGPVRRRRASAGKRRAPAAAAAPTRKRRRRAARRRRARSGCRRPSRCPSARPCRCSTAGRCSCSRARAHRGRLVDAGLAERDYFIAATAEGALVWVYRARLPLSRAPARGGSASGWFLQGRFG